MSHCGYEDHLNVAVCELKVHFDLLIRFELRILSVLLRQKLVLWVAEVSESVVELSI